MEVAILKNARVGRQGSDKFQEDGFGELNAANVDTLSLFSELKAES